MILIFSFLLFSTKKNLLCYGRPDSLYWKSTALRIQRAAAVVAAVAARLTAQAPASASRANAEAAVRATYVECVESVCGRESLLWFHNYRVTSKKTKHKITHKSTKKKIWHKISISKNSQIGICNFFVFVSYMPNLGKIWKKVVISSCQMALLTQLQLWRHLRSHNRGRLIGHHLISSDVIDLMGQLINLFY